MSLLCIWLIISILINYFIYNGISGSLCMDLWWSVSDKWRSELIDIFGIDLFRWCLFGLNISSKSFIDVIILKKKMKRGENKRGMRFTLTTRFFRFFNSPFAFNSNKLNRRALSALNCSLFRKAKLDRRTFDWEKSITDERRRKELRGSGCLKHISLDSKSNNHFNSYRWSLINKRNISSLTSLFICPLAIASLRIAS